MADRGLDRFWGECGSSAPLRLLIWERGRREPVEHRLDRPFAIIGRTEPADLVLDHPQVSRRHAFLQVMGGRVYCLDLGSRSALGWGGGIRRSGWIDPGRPVEIGPYRIGLGTEDARARPAQSPPNLLIDPGIPGDRIALESSAEVTPGLHRRAVDRPLITVGRAPECDLRLSDLSVSRLHCALIRVGESLWVVDLLGRGGVQVDGNRRRWAPLGAGSQLKVGRYLYTIRIESLPTLRLRGPERPSPGLPSPGEPGSPTLPALAQLPARRPGHGLSGSIGPAAAVLRAHLPEPVTVEFPQADATRIAEAMIGPLVDQFDLMQQQLFDQYHHSMMEMMAVFARLHQGRQDHVDRELKKIRRLTREVRSLRKELDRQDGESGRESGPAPPRSSDLDRATSTGESPLQSTPRGAPGDYRAAQARIIARMNELQRERQGRWQRLLGRLSGGGPDEER
ncbi:FHA domain-containing protein [Tautonia plasticadhaerens]|uniref:FHA domain protein n=1 Tax=Tautonia plasticadhaerens TaxID=2527974 RepID=A0A518HC82_9BACT|nr:FHA domain-containing protein [Tautonia plasticadhaerens]QDV38472.1 FHA domain protein [Tautonia plasticadhaerens]